MASGLTVAAANGLLDWLNGVAVPGAVVAPLRLRLMTTNGDAATPGVEVAGGSYMRQVVTMSVAASRVAFETATLDFTYMPSCTVVGGEVWDDNDFRIWWGELDEPLVVPADATLRIEAGDLVTSVEDSDD